MSPLAAGCITALAFAACACAGNPELPARVLQDFSDAAASIGRAEEAGAQRYASRELNLARQKLDEARAAAQRGETDLAARLATQAEADAQLAAAISANEEAQVAAQAVRASLEALRAEERATE